MSKFSRFSAIIIAIVTLVGVGIDAQAEPTGPAVSIVNLRPYNGEGAPNGAVFVMVDKATLCDTNVYMIDMAFGGSKEVYAAALTAFATGKQIQIEIVNSGCTGWGTKVQSLYIIR